MMLAYLCAIVCYCAHADTCSVHSAGLACRYMRVEGGVPSIQKRQLSVWFNRPSEITWSEMSCTQRLHQRMHNLCMCACVRLNVLVGLNL